MPVTTSKYVRKPLYVDAVQVTKENFADVLRWCQGDLGANDGTEFKQVNAADIDPEKQYIRIRVHNPQSIRQTKAFVGDWILYTDRGYKIYTEKAFKENFDAVPEPVRAA
jgi:hypothetical protein